MSRAALVTGGNRGIGLAIARRLQQDGHRVAVTYRTDPPPDDVPGIVCEITSEQSVAAAFAEFRDRIGPVQVLVANAGMTMDKLVLRMSDEDFRTVVDTNLTAAFRLAKVASRDMLKARWGRLIFVSSMIAYLGAAGQANYAASKAGLTGLARSLAWELGPRKITANVVAPGLINTEMIQHVSEARLQHLIGMTPLGHMGEPEDVAHVVGFLASEQSRFMTGAVIPVSGGCAMGY
jgi:NAD(P)-dependent dehydrogenase (short-subunit alcohol dehydrogenase family)